MALLNSYFVEDDEPYPGVPVDNDPGAGFPTEVIDADQPPPPVEASGPKPPKGGDGGPGLPGYLGARPQFNLPSAPVFNYPEFQRPDPKSMLDNPAYQFRLKAGQDALERSAAAKGLLRTGGTLKDLIEYSQGFASSEYDREFDRALQSYDRQYRGAHDAFAPRLSEFQLRGQAELAAALAHYQRQFDLYKYVNPQNTGGGGGPDIPPPPPPPGDVHSYIGLWPE